MIKFKKILVLSLVATMTLSPMTILANDVVEPMMIDPISQVVDMENMAGYIKYHGKITEINKNEKYLSIRVMDDESNPYNGFIFYIFEDVILLDDMTKDFIDKDALKVGMEISTFYSKNTEMLLSLPGQLTPGVIIVRNSEEFVDIKVDKFNKELISADNMLKLNISEDVEILDLTGKEINKENLEDKDLIVFYTFTTRSIPAQTTPVKIIVMDSKEDIKVEEINILDKIIINEKQTLLESSLYKSEEGIIMVPLRQVAEALGYEVTWNGETQTVELTKGAHWTIVKIGEDNYNFARMIVKLGAAPELKDSKTYVPVNFLEEVLQKTVEVTKEGTLIIE